MSYSTRKKGKTDDDKQRQSSDGEEGDNDDDDDDSVDSDFSIDEDDEPRSDLEDEAKAADSTGRTRPKRGQGVQTKAYKEPKRDKDKKIIRKEKPDTFLTKDLKKSLSKLQLAGSGLSSVKSKSHVTSGHSKSIHTSQVALGASSVRKLTRATTVTKTAETAKRQKERLVQHRKLLKRRAQLAAARKDEMRPLTQAEILEEAKITEKLNLESLKRFQEMELEAKKKARSSGRKSLQGSYISYRSTSMPLIQEVSRNYNNGNSGLGNGDDRICVDDEYEDDQSIQGQNEFADGHSERTNLDKNEIKEAEENNTAIGSLVCER